MILLILWTFQLVFSVGLALWCIYTGNILLAVINVVNFLTGILGWTTAYSHLKASKSHQPSTHL